MAILKRDICLLHYQRSRNTINKFFLYLLWAISHLHVYYMYIYVYIERMSYIFLLPTNQSENSYLILTGNMQRNLSVIFCIRSTAILCFIGA